MQERGEKGNGKEAEKRRGLRCIPKMESSEFTNSVGGVGKNREALRMPLRLTWINGGAINQK